MTLFDQEVWTDDVQDEACYEPEVELGSGVEPQFPTEAIPGSQKKVLILAARYAAGLPLWHQADSDAEGGPSAAAEAGPPRRGGRAR